MFEGHYCRRYSSTQDAQIQREMGSQDLDDFAINRIADASTPEQLEALAHQFLCMARRVKAAGVKDYAKRWKDYWNKTLTLAEAAKARLSALPTKDTAPQLYNPRTPGKPGCLDSDFHLPYQARIDIADLAPIGIAKISTGTYSPPLNNGDVIVIHGSRHGKTCFNYAGQANPGLAHEVPTSILRGLLNTGRLIPVPAEQRRSAA